MDGEPRPYICYKRLDFSDALNYIPNARSFEGTSTGDSRSMERVRLPAGGGCDPLPGGSENRPAGMRTGLQGALLHRRRRGLTPVCIRRFSGKRGPELSEEVKAFASAAVERREADAPSPPACTSGPAQRIGRVAAPAAPCRRFSCWRRATRTMRNCACRGSASPFVWRHEDFLGVGANNSGAKKTRREKGIARTSVHVRAAAR